MVSFCHSQVSIRPQYSIADSYRIMQARYSSTFSARSRKCSACHLQLALFRLIIRTFLTFWTLIHWLSQYICAFYLDIVQICIHVFRTQVFIVGYQNKSTERLQERVIMSFSIYRRIYLTKTRHYANCKISIWGRNFLVRISQVTSYCIQRSNNKKSSSTCQFRSLDK